MLVIAHAKCGEAASERQGRGSHDGHQRDTQALHPGANPRFGRAQREAEIGGHLLLGEILEVRQAQRLPLSGGQRIDNRVQEVSYISRHMKILARELNVPVMAAAQLSRAIEQRADKEPQLSDLRESGSLEQDADIVMFINRPEMYEKDTLKQHLAQIKVAKHRNGPVGTIELVFRDNLTKFENAATYVVDLGKT